MIAGVAKMPEDHLPLFFQRQTRSPLSVFIITQVYTILKIRQSALLTKIFRWSILTVRRIKLPPGSVMPMSIRFASR
jgi:hypothetical protein